MESSPQSSAGPTMAGQIRSLLGRSLAFEHGLSVMSGLVALLSALLSMGFLLSLWADSTSGWGLLAGLISTYIYPWSIYAAVATILFGLAAFWLQVRVRRGLKKQPDFTKQAAYRVPLAVALGVYVLLALTQVAIVIGVVLASLVLIGSNSDIGGMYLKQFLPALLALGLLAGPVIATAAQLMRTGGRSLWWYHVILLVVGGVILLTAIITVAVSSHSNNSGVRNLPVIRSNSSNSSNSSGYSW